MRDDTVRFEVMFRLPGAIWRAAKMAKTLAALSVPWALACAAGPDLPVFLPGDRVDCLFEVVGDLTVQGPFRAQDDVPGGAREAMLQAVRLEVGRRTAQSGADAAMVREFIYAPDPAAAEASPPQIVAGEGMLISFVDPTCVPAA